MRWAGLVVAMFALLVGISLGGSVAAFINLPGFLFVLLVGGGIVVAAHGTRAVMRAWQVAWTGVCAENAALLKFVAETGMQAFVAAGWIGLIVGVVQMLCVLDDPSQIGGGAATALLTVLYGYVLAYLGCLPLARAATPSSVVEFMTD